MIPTRPLKSGEAHPCFVGSGACPMNADYEVDDGAGSPVYICAVHLYEFERMEKVIAALPLDQFLKFQQAVDDAEKAISNES